MTLGAVHTDGREAPSLVPLGALLVAGLVVRLVIAATIGPNADETYIAVASRAPAFGYPDHPPLAMWIAAAIRWIAGSESIVLLRLPFIALFTGTTLMVHALARRLFGEAAAMGAVIALSLTPILSIYFGTFVLTDGPFVFFLSASSLCVARAFGATDDRAANAWWLASGVALGLAALSKYTAVFFPAGVALFLLTQPRFRPWLRRPAPWLALVVALAVFSPVLLWNAGHDWISFAFQGGRAAPGLAFAPIRLLSNLAVQSIYFFPPIWVGLAVALWSGLRAGPDSDRSWLIACIAVGPIVFFALVWLLAVEPNKGFHWAAAGYLLLYPYYGWLLADRERQAPGHLRWWFGGTTAVLGLLLVAYLAHTLTGWGQRFQAEPVSYDPVLAEQVEWRDLGARLAELGFFDPSGYVVVAFDWPTCARAAYGLGTSVAVVCADPDGPLLKFDGDWDSLGGRQMILVSDRADLPNAVSDIFPRFESVRPLGSVPIRQYGVTATTVWLFLATA